VKYSTVVQLRGGALDEPRLKVNNPNRQSTVTNYIGGSRICALSPALSEIRLIVRMLINARYSPLREVVWSLSNPPTSSEEEVNNEGPSRMYLYKENDDRKKGAMCIIFFSQALYHLESLTCRDRMWPNTDPYHVSSSANPAEGSHVRPPSADTRAPALGSEPGSGHPPTSSDKCGTSSQ